MNLPDPPEGLPGRLRSFLKAVADATKAKQPRAGKNVTTDEHPGKGTVINVSDDAIRRGAGPPGVPTTGACCYSDFTCAITTPAACSGVGVFLGLGSTCESCTSSHFPPCGGSITGTLHCASAEGVQLKCGFDVYTGITSPPKRYLVETNQITHSLHSCSRSALTAVVGPCADENTCCLDVTLDSLWYRIMDSAECVQHCELGTCSGDNVVGPLHHEQCVGDPYAGGAGLTACGPAFPGTGQCGCGWGYGCPNHFSNCTNYGATVLENSITPTDQVLSVVYHDVSAAICGANQPGNICSGNYYESHHLDVEYTTEDVIAQAQDNEPEYPGYDCPDGLSEGQGCLCSSLRDVSADETYVTMRRFQYYWTFAGPAEHAPCTFCWKLRFQAEGSATSSIIDELCALVIGIAASEPYEQAEPEQDGIIFVSAT